MSNIYKDFFELYVSRGYSIIPGRYGKKTPAIKQWTDYCHKLPESPDEFIWATKTPPAETNLDLCLGPASGVVAVDVDTTDETLLNILKDRLPPAPEKFGAKGFTRFYKYSPVLHTEQVKMNGDVVFELLAEGKKTTLPPSLHPNGENYIWSLNGRQPTPEELEKGIPTLENTLPSELPMLPPALLTNIASEIRGANTNWDLKSPTNHTKLVNGRNDALLKYCSALILENKSIEEIVGSLIKYDKQHHDIPLLSDPNEFRHTDVKTNALTFYTNILNSFNCKNARNNNEYHTPYFKTLDVDTVEVFDVEKIKRLAGKQKRLNLDLPTAKGVVGLIQNWIMENSPIPQPKFALSAALSLVSTCISRKAHINGITPNLYTLNVAASASGKDAPQKLLKHLFQSVPQGRTFLGAGNFSSDAAILDTIGSNPVVLMVGDEASKFLSAVGSPGAHYQVGMNELFCELYTSARDYFPGKKMASYQGKEVIKGACEHPHINLLLSTTPAGIKEAMSADSINKGFLGRCIVLMGDSNALTQDFPDRVTPVHTDVHDFMMSWLSWGAEPGQISMGSSVDELTKVGPDDETRDLMREFREEMHKEKLNLEQDSVMRPLLGRVYVTAVKLALIHCCGRMIEAQNIITMNASDFAFGKDMSLLLFNDMKELVEENIFFSPYDKKLKRVKQVIKNAGIITETQLHQLLSFYDARTRSQLLKDLIENQKVVLKERDLYVWSNYLQDSRE